MRYDRPMRIVFVLALSLIALPASGETLEAFKARIEAAYGQADQAAAVGALFYKDGLGEDMQAMLGRAVGHITRRDAADVRFVPVPGDARLAAVVDGYEYRPNLDVLGYADLGANEFGGTTQVPYGQGPDGRYYFTATTKTLVKANAAPDKQLLMMVIGLGAPPITFEGWCDILQSNDEIIRIKFDDKGAGNQTRVMRGQAIAACAFTNTAGRGALSVRLTVDQEVIFEQRAEAPDTVVRYR